MTVIDRIHAHGRFSGKPGLHRIRALCAALGNPQKGLKFVHLAGTNGKGSTAAMLAAVLQQAGYRTGLFTSPFLVTFHERIQINGQMVSDADLQRLAERVEQAERTLTLPAGECIGEFEFVTALGFLYFAEQGCDIVVLETGLGGSFDATNVIDPPEVAVLTSISLDHTAVLGHTTGEIARTTAGIFKPGSAAICAPGQPEDAMTVIRSVRPDVQVPSPAEAVRCDWAGGHFRWQGESYDVPLIGPHQVQNACTALQAIEALRSRGWTLPSEVVAVGLAHAFLPGRMQILRKNPHILVDGGHNIGGVKAIRSTVDALPFDGRLLLVIGMVADKDVKACASILADVGDAVFATQPDSERALPAAELATLLPAAKVQGTFVHAADALRAVLAAAQPTDTILICGSLYLVGEAEKFFAS